MQRDDDELDRRRLAFYALYLQNYVYISTSQIAYVPFNEVHYTKKEMVIQEERVNESESVFPIPSLHSLFASIAINILQA